MYCNCMNLKNTSFLGAFERVETNADGTCVHCQYYTVKEVLIDAYGQIQDKEVHQDADRKLKGKSRLVSKWHMLDTFYDTNLKRAKQNRDMLFNNRKMYNEDFKKKIVDKLVDSTLSIETWSTKLGIGVTALYNWFDEYGGKERKRNKLLNEIKRLKANGHSRSNISRILNIAPITLRKYERKYINE